MSANAGARYYVIGGSGAIGSALMKSLSAQRIEAIASTRRQPVDRQNEFYLDLGADLPELSFSACDVVILTASMTRLAECRSEPELARRVNVDAQVLIAEQAVKKGAFVVFLSTNQVFDGTKSGVGPEEPRSPRSVYGKLKAEAESALSRLGDSVAIVRLSKVVGPHLDLLQRWRRELSRGETIEAFDDLLLAPIAMAKVVAGVELIGLKRLGGVWHLGGSDEISYLQAGRHLACRLGADARLVVSASAAKAGIPVEERPPRVSMAPGNLETAIGVRIGDALEELDIGLGFADWTRTDICSRSDKIIPQAM